jgi:very-short-patch-repair endonuclease
VVSKKDAEDVLAQTLTLAGGPLAEYERQFRYVPGRKFAADFSWPAYRLLVEIQGGVWNRKAHGSITGVLADIERLNLATLNGWRLLRFVTDEITDDYRLPDTLETIERALEA